MKTLLILALAFAIMFSGISVAATTPTGPFEAIKRIDQQDLPDGLLNLGSLIASVDVSPIRESVGFAAPDEVRESATLLAGKPAFPDWPWWGCLTYEYCFF